MRIGGSTGCFFSLSPPPTPNLTESQALYKFLDLQNLWVGQFKFIQGLRGEGKKKNPCIISLILSALYV
jgi:hypothetical protein